MRKCSSASDRLTGIALDVPFLLLPFRPSSDPSAAKTFVRNYFFPPGDRKKLSGQSLLKELKMAEVMVWKREVESSGCANTLQGLGRCHEMVLGASPRRCGNVGGLSGFQSRRKRWAFPYRPAPKLG